MLKIPRDKLPHIYLDCGTEDPLLADNKTFAKMLIDNNITCTIGISPGDIMVPSGLVRWRTRWRLRTQ